MSKSLAFDQDLLQMIFNGTPIANICDNAASSPLTTLYCALHVSDPTSSGTQNSGEVAYTGYSRAAVARTTGGWVVSSNSVSPAANISFPAGSAGSGTATYMSVGIGSVGATKILYSGPISPPIVCGAGITPIVTAGSTIGES